MDVYVIIAGSIIYGVYSDKDEAEKAMKILPKDFRANIDGPFKLNSNTGVERLASWLLGR